MNLHRIKNITLVMLAISFLASPVVAQKLQLSVEQAQQYAIVNNRQAANARIATEESKAKLTEAIANGLPQIDATANYNNFLGATSNFMGQTIEFNPTSSAQLTASQLVFSGSYWVGVQLSKMARQITEVSKAQTENNLKSEVANAYYMALVARRAHNLAAVNLQNLLSIQKTTNLSAEVGVIEQLQADQLAVQVAMVENSVKQAERQIELSENLLRLQLGVGADAQLELTDNLDKVVAEINLSQLLESGFSINNNFDYRLMLGQEEIVKKQIQMQQSAALPTLAAFYNYTYKIIKPNFDISPSQVVGLNLSVPLFSSGLRNAKVKQARLQLETVQNQRELLSDQINIQVKQARFNLKNAGEQFTNQQKNLALAQKVFENINLKFQQGLVSGTDLTTANNNYVSAQNSYVMSLLQLLQAGNELQRLLAQ